MKAAARKRLAERLKAKGVKQPYVVIDEAKRADILVGTALAMLEMETGIPQRNIFGCDHGPGRVFCHQDVTKARVAELRRGFPGTMNGVGWTQLTWYELVNEAEREGGAHIPRFQMRIGFRQLRRLFDQHRDLQTMYARYNGSGAAAERYGHDAVELRRKWLGVTEGK